MSNRCSIPDCEGFIGKDGLCGECGHDITGDDFDGVVADSVEETVAEESVEDEVGNPANVLENLMKMVNELGSMSNRDYISNSRKAATSVNEVITREAAKRDCDMSNLDVDNPFTFEEDLQIVASKVQSMGMADITKQLYEIDKSLMLRVQQEERLYNERKEPNADQHVIATQLKELNENLNAMTEGQDRMIVALKDIWTILRSQ